MFLAVIHHIGISDNKHTCMLAAESRNRIYDGHITCVSALPPRTTQMQLQQYRPTAVASHAGTEKHQT